MTLEARIVGDGPERTSLERMIVNRGLTQEVTLCGSLSHRELREVYRDADVFVLASVEESFGLAALEARASGLPVVVLVDTGPTSFIRQEQEGLIADSDQDLAPAIIRLALDSNLHREIVQHNRNVPLLFQWSTAIQKHLDIYDIATGTQA
jgi:phosphatidylinositol alpha 1,6-mannosyltransferase